MGRYTVDDRPEQECRIMGSFRIVATQNVDQSNRKTDVDAGVKSKGGKGRKQTER